MSEGPYIAKMQHQLIKALKASTAAATLACLLGIGSQLAIAEQPGDQECARHDQSHAGDAPLQGPG
jgi:hypothetical protein